MDAHSFDPTGNTIAIVTGVSAATALPDTGVGPESRDYRLYNSGTDTVYVAFGTSTIVVTAPAAGVPANGIPIPGGAIEVMRSSTSERYIGTLAPSGTPTLFVTAGSGL